MCQSLCRILCPIVILQRMIGPKRQYLNELILLEPQTSQPPRQLLPNHQRQPDGLVLLLWGWAAQRTLGRVKALTGVWINRVSGALMIGAAALLGLKDIERAAR